MTTTRRRVFRLLAAGALMPVATGYPAHAQSAEAWYRLEGDDGRPLANMRLPVELTLELEELRGIIWLGAESRAQEAVELYDYNCPYCRRAAADLPALLKEVPGLRLGLLNNPILSPQSAQAAKVEIAVLKLKGAAAAYDFHRRLFARRGTIDGRKALDTAQAMGLDRGSVEANADSEDVRAALRDQMRLAASLGAAATPSYVIAGAGLYGYPGPQSLRRILTAVEQCGEVSC
jgi:protein-disulfide isomerase